MYVKIFHIIPKQTRVIYYNSKWRNKQSSCNLLRYTVFPWTSEYYEINTNIIIIIIIAFVLDYTRKKKRKKKNINKRHSYYRVRITVFRKIVFAGRACNLFLFRLENRGLFPGQKSIVRKPYGYGCAFVGKGIFFFFSRFVVFEVYNSNYVTTNLFTKLLFWNFFNF